MYGNFNPTTTGTDGYVYGNSSIPLGSTAAQYGYSIPATEAVPQYSMLNPAAPTQLTQYGTTLTGMETQPSYTTALPGTEYMQTAQTTSAVGPETAYVNYNTAGIAPNVVDPNYGTVLATDPHYSSYQTAPAASNSLYTGYLSRDPAIGIQDYQYKYDVIPTDSKITRKEGSLAGYPSDISHLHRFPEKDRQYGGVQGASESPNRKHSKGRKSSIQRQNERLNGLRQSEYNTVMSGSDEEKYHHKNEAMDADGGRSGEAPRRKISKGAHQRHNAGTQLVNGYNETYKRGGVTEDFSQGGRVEQPMDYEDSTKMESGDSRRRDLKQREATESLENRLRDLQQRDATEYSEGRGRDRKASGATKPDDQQKLFQQKEKNETLESRLRDLQQRDKTIARMKQMTSYAGSDSDLTDTERSQVPLRRGLQMPQHLFLKYQDYYKLDQTDQEFQDPVTYHRAKRASRASVLNKAEMMLETRRMSKIPDINSSDEEGQRLRKNALNRMMRIAGSRTSPESEYMENTRSPHAMTSPEVDDSRLHKSKGKYLRRRRSLPVRSRRQKSNTLHAMRFQNEPLPPQMSEEDEDDMLSDKGEGTRRYEARNGDGRLKNMEVTKGRRVIFYRNGDPNFRGKRVNVNRKNHQNLNCLMTDLSTMIETPSGVEHIFSWPEGRLIQSITEIQDQQTYIVSSVKKLNRDIKYGKSREQYWQTGKLKHDDVKLIKGKGGTPNGSPNYKKPRVFTIVSNMHRNSWEKVILNPDTKQNFEDVMADIADMIFIPEPPLRALYQMGDSLPFRPVESLTTLFRDCKDGDTLLACGEEKIPKEMQPKRPAPSSHSSDSGTGGTGRRRPLKKLQLESSSSSRGDVAQIFDVSPTRNSRGGQQLATRKSWNDAVIRMKINGKFKEFYPPTVMYYDEDGAKPDKTLRLDWVYGYNGNDPRSALLVLPDSGELVYYVSSIAVLYDRTSATQRYYQGHTEEITCMVLLPDGEKVATGQQAGKTAAEDAHVRIWDGHSLSTYSVIGLGAFGQGVLSIAFSPDMDNDLMLVIDDSDKHVLSVWEYKNEKCLAQTGTTGDPVMHGCFYPYDDTIIITYGKGHLFFWKLDWDKYKIWRDKKSGLSEEDMPKQVQVTSLCFTSTGEVVTGDSTGSITVWQRDQKDIFTIDTAYSFMKKAHARSVNALCMLEDGTLLSGGGTTVRAWDTMNRFKRVKERQIQEIYGNVRSIVPQIIGGYDGGLYIGTTKSHILEGSLQSKFTYLVQGHSEELWAIATSPTEPMFVTAGHDQMVVKWSAVTHQAVWKTQVERPCVSIAIEPKGRLVALGTTAGRMIILNAKTGSHLQTIQVGQVQINAISFSQDGQNIALGDHDGYIYLFSAGDDGHIYATHSSLLVHNVRDNFITQLDWSHDGSYIQAVTGDYDIVYFDVDKLQRVRFPKVARDADWYSQTCTVGYPLAGAWQNLKSGEVINVATRSNYRDFIATGDNKGRLRLYKYPCSANKPDFHNKKAYSSNVTAVAFTCDDRHMISSGGQGTGDTALLQWGLVSPAIQR